MLEESNKMIKDSESRHGKAVEDLRDLVVRCVSSRQPSPPSLSSVAQIRARKETGLENDQELLKAEEALATANI